MTKKDTSIITMNQDSDLIVYYILKYIQHKMPSVSVCEMIGRALAVMGHELIY